MPDESCDSHQTREELLTRQFYEWEVRGRGWQVWDAPVELEPPFRPFWSHCVPMPRVADDALRETAFSTWALRMKGRLSGHVLGTAASPAEDAPQVPEALPEPTPASFTDESAIVEMSVALPPGKSVSRDVTEQFLLSLHYAHAPFSFELVGSPDSIRVVFVCRERDAPRLRQQLRSYFPECAIRGDDGFLSSLWNREPAVESALVDFGLSHEFVLPLRTYRSFEVDPLIALAGAMGELGAGEVAAVQVLFQEATAPWAENVLRAVTDNEGSAFFADGPDLVARAKEKVSRPLYAAVLRVAAQSASSGRAWEIVRALGGALAQFSAPIGNALVPLENEGYPDYVHAEDLLLRRSHRSGMILNVDELVALVHLPSDSVRAERLEREVKKTKAAPAVSLGHALVLGENAHNGKTVAVSLGTQQRLRHTYVIGASGTGKSTLLLNMIVQDLHHGEGFAVLDPHGDLIDWILGNVPEDRFDDVVLIDPSDEDYPVGFNILSAHSEVEKHLLASDLVSVFRRLSTTWGDQMTSVLGNAILAFLESTKGGTLADLRRFLVEPDYREPFLQTVKDPDIVYYWQREFPLLTGRPQAPLLTRLDTFLRPRLIRNMVVQKQDRLDFRSMMDSRKVILAKLAQGSIGEENAYLLGTLIVAKLHQMALGRQNVPESERQPFYVYIDEFHNFITPSIAAILSGARKFGMGLVLSHQELSQIFHHSPEVASAVITNPATRVCFRLGDDDAKKLQGGFSAFDARDLQSLGVGEAIARIERSEYDFTLKTLPLPKVDPVTARERRERVVAISRERYARKREEVEREMASARPTAPPSKPGKDFKPGKPFRRFSPPPQRSFKNERPPAPNARSSGRTDEPPDD
jgi:hypothetical protein